MSSRSWKAALEVTDERAGHLGAVARSGRIGHRTATTLVRLQAELLSKLWISKVEEHSRSDGKNGSGTEGIRVLAQRKLPRKYARWLCGRKIRSFVKSS